MQQNIADKVHNMLKKTIKTKTSHNKHLTHTENPKTA